MRGTFPLSECPIVFIPIASQSKCYFISPFFVGEVVTSIAYIPEDYSKFNTCGYSFPVVIALAK